MSPGIETPGRVVPPRHELSVLRERAGFILLVLGVLLAPVAGYAGLSARGWAWAPGCAAAMAIVGAISHRRVGMDRGCRRVLALSVMGQAVLVHAAAGLEWQGAAGLLCFAVPAAMVALADPVAVALDGLAACVAVMWLTTASGWASLAVLVPGVAGLCWLAARLRAIAARAAWAQTRFDGGSAAGRTRGFAEFAPRAPRFADIVPPAVTTAPGLQMLFEPQGGGAFRLGVLLGQGSAGCTTRIVTDGSRFGVQQEFRAGG